VNAAKVTALHVPGVPPGQAEQTAPGPGWVLYWPRRGATLLPFGARALAVILPALATGLLLG